MKPTEIAIPVATAAEIERRLAAVARLSQDAMSDHVVILGFAVLEAIARLALRPRLSRPQKPGSVVETLAFEGYVAPVEASRLRQLIAKRNRIVHGDLACAITSTEASDFVSILKDVWSLADQREVQEA